MLSCPAPSTNLVDNGSVAYQKPAAPKNVVATRGQQDTIVLSWDPVENAELYIVYGIEGSSFDSEMQPYAYTTNNTITFSYVAPGTSLGAEDEAIDIPRSFDRDEIYIFCVKAYVSYESADDYLLSASSDYAEGCFAPSTVEFYPIVSSDKVRLMWNCSNLFSILNTGLEPEPLYKTQFTVTYVDESTKESKTITAKDVGAGSDPWLFAELPASDYFTHDNRYTFTVQLSVLDDEGNSIATVSSKSVTITMNDSLLVSAIEEVSATDGTLAGKVEIKWQIPSWSLPVTRNNSYYTVQRREAGTDEWTSVIDEISTMTASDDISFNGNECTYYDLTAEQGKSYEYQVLNVFVDNTGTPREGEGVPGIAKGSVFNPDSDNLAAEWIHEDGTATGTASLSWETTSQFLPDGLAWAIERTVWHGSDDSTKVDIITDGISYDAAASSVTWAVNINEDVTSSCSVCKKANSIHTYAYRPVIIDSSSRDTLYEFGVFEIEAQLGDPVEYQIFRDFRVSNNLVKKIRLYWTVTDAYKNSNIEYSYNTGSGYINIDYIHKEGSSSYYTDIQVADGEGLSIRLKAAAGQAVSYESPNSLAGKSLDKLPEIIASDGSSGTSIDVSWDSFEAASDVIYSINEGNMVLLSSVDPSKGTASIATGTGTISNTGDRHTLKLVATDITGDTLESSADEGYVLPMPTDISASKGDHSGEVRITWKGYDDMVDRYEVLRFSSASLSGEPEAVYQASSAELNDAENIIPGYDYYYTVRAVKGSAYSEYMTEFEVEENILPGADEPANLGYSFIHSGISNVIVEELEDPNHAGYVADFIRVTFPANKTAASYTIESTLTGYEYPITYVIDDALIAGAGGIYTNGKGSDEVGYVAYDEDEGTITINTDAGILNNNLEIEDIYIIGNSKDSISTTDSIRTSTGNANRNPHLYDYINIFNSVLSETLTDADDNMDGWAEYSWNDRMYYGSGYTIERAVRSIGWSNGSISFSGRRGNEYPVTLSNAGNLTLDVNIIAGTGYPLQRVATGDNDGSIENTLTFNTVSVGTSSLNVKDVTIKIWKLNASPTDSTKSGSYWVTPEFGSESTEQIYSQIGNMIPNVPNIR